MLPVYFYGGVIFYIAALISFIVSILLIRPYRPVYLLMIAVPVIAGTGYFLMGQNVGLLMQNNQLINITRYADWLLTTPLLLFTLVYAMYPNVSERWKNFLLILCLDIAMLATGLGAELTDGNLRTLFFSISSLAYLSILYIIVDRLLILNSVFDSKSLRRSVLLLAWIVIGLWSVYPFVWIFGPHGMEIISTMGETQAYLLLDVLTKTGFNIFLLQFLYNEVHQATPTHDT